MPTELFQTINAYEGIKHSLRERYLSDPRPWLVGFSGGKDSTLVAALVFEAALAIPPAQRTKEIHVVCTDMWDEDLAGKKNTAWDRFCPSECDSLLPEMSRLP
jgi:3'-phosphoadenosine 5'-phosphosulfate sulfotransferase (PAPS reductase)/FAD synthetase